MSAAVGESHTCALLEDGRVACFGRPDVRAPTYFTMSFGSDVVVALHAGYRYTCAYFSNGEVKCFGRIWNAYPTLKTRDFQGGKAGAEIPYVRFVEILSSAPTHSPTHVQVDLLQTVEICIILFSIGGVLLLCGVLALSINFCLATAQKHDYERWKRKIRLIKDSCETGVKTMCKQSRRDCILCVLYPRSYCAMLLHVHWVGSVYIGFDCTCRHIYRHGLLRHPRYQ